MGYTPPTTVYTLDFTDTEYDGMQVKMRATTLGALLDAPELVGSFSRIAERFEAAGDAAIPEAEDVARMVDQYRELAEHLVSWNLDAKDKSPLPATLEGLKTLEMPLIQAIASAWREAMAGVAPPLPNASPRGSLPDVPLAMQEIPESLSSLTAPN